MGPLPDDAPGSNSLPPRGPDDRAPADVQIRLAEFTALRAEIDRRANIQWNVFALQVASSGAIGSLAITSISKATLLLIIPMLSFMLGSRYILHDYHIKLIQDYIRDSLSPSLSGALGWTRWKMNLPQEARSSGWFSIIGWKVTHSTRLAFEGVAALALISAVCLAGYAWVKSSPPWYVILGFAVWVVIDGLLIVLLDRAFERSKSDTAVSV
jgi:hypothetical protein